MKKLLPKIVFQNIPIDQKQKIETLKVKIAAGEYQINPQNLAENLMARGVLINMYKACALSHPWHLKPGSF